MSFLARIPSNAKTKKLVSAFLSERHIQVLSSILKESDKIFGGFISGKIIDSLIIGAICFVCCLILRMPYVALVSVMVGVTNVIPFLDLTLEPYQAPYSSCWTARQRV